MKDFKHNILIGLVVLVLAAVLITAWPAQSDKQIVKVQGEATLDVAADEVQFIVAIEHKGKEASLVQEENSKVVNALLSSFKQKGLKVETLGYNLNPDYTYENGKREEVGFVVRQTLKVTTTNLEKIGEYVRDAVDLGATNVHSIQFRVSEKLREQTKAQLLQKATADARLRAESLAKGAKGRVGKVAFIEEMQGYSGPVYMAARADVVEAKVAPEIAPPESLSVETTVQVGFYLK